MAEMKEDPAQVKAAQILVKLRYRELERRPEWVPMPLGEEASSSARTAATEVKRSGKASSSAATVAAGVMRSGEASSSAGTVAAGVPAKWPQKKRSGSRGETSREPEQGHVAAAAAAKGSGAPQSSEQERCAELLAASALQRPVVAALCYAAVAGAGTGPSSSSAAPVKEAMETPSPDTPLDYDAGGSGAPSSADDAAPAPARPQAKRKGIGGDGKGCSSPAKRGPVAEEEKVMPISVEPRVQSETCASSGKGEPFPFDLNLPCTLDDDDGDCPDAT